MLAAEAQMFSWERGASLGRPAVPEVNNANAMSRGEAGAAALCLCPTAFPRSVNVPVASPCDALSSMTGISRERATEAARDQTELDRIGLAMRGFARA